MTTASVTGWRRPRSPGSPYHFWVLAALLANSSLLSVGQVWAQDSGGVETRVEVESDGWRLVGDLRMPPGAAPFPAALLLNQADGDRAPYRELADHLARRGVASLRLDLRGHGESTNLGAFVPGREPRSPMIWDAEADVTAAVQSLAASAGIDGARIAVVGASYSGEEMAEAGRLHGFASAHVALSPGSFSDESIDAMDESGVPWLLVSARDDPFLSDIVAAVLDRSAAAELWLLPGRGHATDLLVSSPGLAERLATWLAVHLGPADAQSVGGEPAWLIGGFDFGPRPAPRP